MCAAAPKATRIARRRKSTDASGVLSVMRSVARPSTRGQTRPVSEPMASGIVSSRRNRRRPLSSPSRRRSVATGFLACSTTA